MIPKERRQRIRRLRTQVRYIDIDVRRVIGDGRGLSARKRDVSRTAAFGRGQLARKRGALDHVVEVDAPLDAVFAQECVDHDVFPGKGAAMRGDGRACPFRTSDLDSKKPFVRSSGAYGGTSQFSRFADGFEEKQNGGDAVIVGKIINVVGHPANGFVAGGDHIRQTERERIVRKRQRYRTALGNDRRSACMRVRPMGTPQCDPIMEVNQAEIVRSANDHSGVGGDLCEFGLALGPFFACFGIAGRVHQKRTCADRRSLSGDLDASVGRDRDKDNVDRLAEGFERWEGRKVFDPVVTRIHRVYRAAETMIDQVSDQEMPNGSFSCRSSDDGNGFRLQ
nr:hypothetical protein [Pararhizobium mangrovi]